MKDIRGRLHRIITGAGCLCLLSVMPGICVHAEQTQYRALLVTRGDYTGTAYDLTPGPENDGVNVSRMLQNAYGETGISVTTKDSLKTKSELKQAIQDAFADSDADDINYFYYSGHGLAQGLCLELGKTVSAQDLYDCFEGIQGNNVLIMDCCYSGKMGTQTKSIGLQSLMEESSSQNEQAEDFVRAFTEAFALAEQQNHLFQSRTVLNSSRFTLLMAAAEDELSNQVIRTPDQGDSAAIQASSYGAFTGSLVYGNGIDAELAEKEVSLQTAAIGSAPADYDGDGNITFNEVARFTKNHCVASHMSMYPSDNKKVFLPATQKSEAASFDRAVLESDKDGKVKLRISYQAREDVKAQVAWYSAENDWGLQQLLFTVTDPYGLPDFEKDAGIEKLGGQTEISLKQGTGSFEISLEEGKKRPGAGYYACMVRTDRAKFSYMIPFAASGEDFSLLNKMTLDAPEEQELSSEEEWELRADFGTYTSQQGGNVAPLLPIPLVSCRILNEKGETVRVLADQEMAEVVQIDGGEEYQCRITFRWDGCNATGRKVRAGIYTAVVKAEDVSGSRELERTVKLLGENGSETESETETSPTEKTDPTQPSEGETGKKDSASETDGTVKKEVQSVSAVCVSRFSGLEKSGTKITLGVKEQIQLNPVIIPTDAAEKNLTYRSSNTRVAGITQTGKIRAKKQGNAVITVMASGGKSCRIKVTVKKAPKKVSLNAKKKTLKKGKNFQIKTKLPSGSAAFGIRYLSSNQRVASVNARGKVHAKKKGSAVITVRLYNGRKAALKLTVR